MAYPLYIAFAHKDHIGMCAAGLSDEEKIRRSDGYVFYGMRLPNLQEAQDFLTACKINLGKKKVWRTQAYGYTVPQPNQLFDIPDAGDNNVFAWKEPQYKAPSKSGYKVVIATGYRKHSYGTDLSHILIPVGEKYDSEAVGHDLAVECQCSPDDANDGSFNWDTETAALPEATIKGIMNVAAADALRALGRHLNDLYLTESPSETDGVDAKRVKKLRCDGLQLAMDAVKDALSKLKEE